ncbi:uncharacterized protein P174DRAFT_58603 [Aspergillus novofumigatus IBT 16806]|uniref:Uncharacterized protein n=1 Tax=Aspergillus novofumigatus (strain IBT 16806) TaxID=1392255 RepID=A0A2I1BVW1_ASPN1|nr:uncharacterized protein P174DRAFT_58603 [Aspergillus novofumigatus IBT 16806]PKX89441.1 hypothetical protein P174DRAFT_58603 [Aspergillus novofumigatus IBT 16806]
MSLRYGMTDWEESAFNWALSLVIRGIGRMEEGARVLFICASNPLLLSISRGAPITTWDATIPRTTKQGSRRINIADMVLCKSNGLLRGKCSKFLSPDTGFVTKKKQSARTSQISPFSQSQTNSAFSNGRCGQQQIHSWREWVISLVKKMILSSTDRPRVSDVYSADVQSH